MRRSLTALLAFASASAGAQVHTQATELRDGNGDGLIELTRPAGPFRAGDVVKRCKELPAYTYVTHAEACPPPASPGPAAAAAEPLWGINISGGEFRGVEGGQLIPRPDELQAYHDAGFRLFRIPFKASQLDRADARAKLVALAGKCMALGVPCVFDRHEYKWPAVADQVAFWVRFAAAMPKSDLIHLDLMNEPKGFNDEGLTNDWLQWARDAQAIITGLRAAGVTNRIWLEWPGYTAAYRFDKQEPARKACESAKCAIKRSGGIVDPIGRTGFQAHRYFNKGGSGTDDLCQTATSLASFAASARAFGMPVMLGESAFGSDRGMRPECEAVGRKAIAELRAAGFWGVTWWGGGRAWKRDYLHFTPAAGEYRYKAMLLGR